MTNAEKLQQELENVKPLELKVNMIAYIRAPKWSGYFIITDMTDDRDIILGHPIKCIEVNKKRMIVLCDHCTTELSRYIRALYGKRYEEPNPKREYEPMQHEWILDLMNGSKVYQVWQRPAKGITLYELEEKLGYAIDIKDMKK